MSLSLNGTTQYADTSATPITEISSTDVTIACWGRMTNITTAVDGLVHIGEGGGVNAHSILLRKTSGSASQATVFDASSNSSGTSTTTDATLNKWIHYSAVFTGLGVGGWTAYLAGTDGGANAAGRSALNAFTLIRIGAYLAGTNFWEGQISHVGIWNIALSGAELASLAAGANPLAVQSANLVAYYPFTDSGDLYTDQAGSYDLTATGSPTYSSQEPTVDAPPATTQFFQYQNRANTLLRM